MTQKNIIVNEIENGLLLENISDFNAKHIFECGQCFRWNKEADDSYTGVAYDRVINVKSDHDNKKVTILNTNIEDFNNIWFDYFDLGRDYGKIKRKLSLDPILKKAIGHGDGIRILKQQPWEILISFIVSANNRIPMISKSINLLSELYGQAMEYNKKVYYSFPTVKQLYNAEINDIKRCKAGFRCKYIKKAVEMISSGEIDLSSIGNMKTHEARGELMKIPGVGIKVADCILLFSMQKFDAYPVDVWVKRVTEHFYMECESKLSDIHDFAYRKFGSLAGFAQEYLFYYARELKIGRD